MIRVPSAQMGPAWTLGQKILDRFQADPLLKFGCRFFALAIAGGQVVGDAAVDQRELHQLFHHVHHPIVIG